MRRIDIDDESLAACDGLSCRAAAARLGVSKDVIARIRSTRGAPRPQAQPPSLFLRNERPLRETGAGVVGIVGDMHQPFCLRDYLDHCYNTFQRYRATRFVFIGDCIDHHAISYHEHTPDGMSPGDEFAEALAAMHEWYQEFPEATWILGNHDKLPMRKAFSAGLPAHFLRENLYETPKGWRQVESAVLDNVLYVHGGGKYASGQYGHRHLAARRAQSCVIGHNHYYGGTYYMPSIDGAQIFGLQVGCGIDHRSYAMAYCRDDGPPAIGCGVVIDGREAHYVPMLRG